MQHLGINLASTRIVTVQTTFNPKINLSKPMKRCLAYSLFFGMFSAILLGLFANVLCIHLLHNKVSSYLFYIIAISLPFISMSSALNGYFTALRKNGKNAIARIFEQFVKISSTAFLLSLFMPSGLEYACLSLVLGEAISEIMSFLFVFVLYIIEKKKHTIEDNTNVNYVKSIFKITLPVSITSYIRSGLTSLKQLLIPLRLEKSGMDCNTAISNYGLINGMAMPVLMFPEVIINSFSGLLVPEFTYYYTKHNFNRISEIISKIFRITLLFSIGTIGVFIFYSNNISLLIYNNLDIAIYLKILSPLLLFMYLDSIVDNILKGLNQQLSVMKCNILDLFVSITCIYILLPIFGLNGYIFIIFLSEILNSGISILQLKQITHFKFDFRNWIVKPFIGIVLSYFICTILVPNIIPTASCIILQIILFLGCYFAFLLVSNAFEV